jgi:capsular polysaccharide biosynthesis protein/MinD-like ATPase involved in chromosome partitioning or flagellar assembly
VNAEPTSIPDKDSGDGVAQVLRLLRERWWIPLACALACAGGGVLMSAQAQPEYQATSRLVFRQFGVGTALFGSSVIAPTVDPARELATNTELITSRTVAGAVVRRLQLDMTPDQLLGRIKVQTESASDIARITVSSDRPADAAGIANAYVSEAVASRRQADQAKVAAARTLLVQRLAALPRAATAQRRELTEAVAKLVELEAVQTGNAEVASRAGVPTEAVSRQPVRTGFIGGVLGLALGVALAFALERLDPRLKEAGELEERLGVSVLARVPVRGPSANGTRAYHEAFRLLAAMLRLGSGDEGVTTIAVTSPGDSEGKTTTAFELALAAVEAGQRVVLIDGDGNRSALEAMVGGSHAHRDRSGGGRSTRGLTDYLAGRAAIVEVVHPTPHPGLMFVPAGTVASPGLVRLLEGRLGRSFLVELASWPTGRRLRATRPPDKRNGHVEAAPGREGDGRFGRDLPTLVLIDCPSVGKSAEAVILASRADAVLLVVDLKRSAAHAIDATLRRLTAANIRISGVVVNRDTAPGPVYRDRPPAATPSIPRRALFRPETVRRSSTH